MIYRMFGWGMMFLAILGVSFGDAAGHMFMLAMIVGGVFLILSECEKIRETLDAKKGEK